MSNQFKKIKFENKFLDSIDKECFLNIFMFLDDEDLPSICCTCKYFKYILDDPLFWKYKLERTESWKALYKMHMTKRYTKLNAGDLFDLSQKGLERCVLNSPLLHFILKMCKKVSDLGYWGIYFNGSKEDGKKNSDGTKEDDQYYSHKWPSPINNTLRHFNCHEQTLGSKLDIGFACIYERFFNFYKEKRFDFNPVIAHLRSVKNLRYCQYINIKRKMVRFNISWEPK